MEMDCIEEFELKSNDEQMSRYDVLGVRGGDSVNRREEITGEETALALRNDKDCYDG